MKQTTKKLSESSADYRSLFWSLFGERQNPDRGFHHYLFMAMGWSLLVGVLFVLYLRGQSSQNVLAIALVGLTPMLAIPVTLTGISAWLSRSPALQVAATALGFTFIATIAPLDAVVGCRATESPDEITIMTANVLKGSTDPQAFANTVMTFEPDFLMLQEATEPFLNALSADSRIDAIYTERSGDYPWANTGKVVWSRFPFSSVDFGPSDGSTVDTLVAETPFGPIRVGSIHTTAPSRQETVPPWTKQFERLKVYPNDAPTILAGDFNATEDHKPFRDLLRSGWTDAHNDKGCGPDATWPTSGLPFAVFRLDHVLVSDHFKVLSVGMALPHGSDHKPVVAKVRLADSEASGG